MKKAAQLYQEQKNIKPVWDTCNFCKEVGVYLIEDNFCWLCGYKETSNNANNALVGSCFSCLYWENPTYNDKKDEIGRCSKLSGIHKKEVNTIEIYPDIKSTGIESIPICWHDGNGFDYETKSWFGCVHYKDR